MGVVSEIITLIGIKKFFYHLFVLMILAPQVTILRNNFEILPFYLSAQQEEVTVCYGLIIILSTLGECELTKSGEIIILDD